MTGVDCGGGTDLVQSVSYVQALESRLRKRFHPMDRDSANVRARGAGAFDEPRLDVRDRS